ncbi:transposase, partial [Shouchella clausii]|nr:transposase [Shouchella clausii]
FFGDFLTLADPEASLGEKALATTFILVKPAKVGEVVYDLSKVRKVKTGRKGNGNRVGNFTGKINADNIPNMTKNDILEGLPSNWKHTEYNGFVHIRDANGNIRMRIDPPDKVTKYDHVHIFDESGNPLDVNLNVVDRKSPDAHIPYKK